MKKEETLEHQTTDNEELKIAIGNMKCKSFKGAGNFCSNCKREGNFGSIMRYTCESDTEYLICGWCGDIKNLGKSTAGFKKEND